MLVLMSMFSLSTPPPAPRPPLPPFAPDQYTRIPRKCNPCCSQNHPLTRKGPERCGDGVCPSPGSSLDDAPCAIMFYDKATLTNGLSKDGTGTGDAFWFHDKLIATMRTDGDHYLDKTVGRTVPTGVVQTNGGLRTPCSGFCADSCSANYGTVLIYLATTYTLAAGNSIRTTGWGKGYMECGGFADGADAKTAEYAQNNHAETPNYDSYSLDACIGATWILAEGQGSCGGVQFGPHSTLRVVNATNTQSTAQTSALRQAAFGTRASLTVSCPATPEVVSMSYVSGGNLITLGLKGIPTSCANVPLGQPCSQRSQFRCKVGRHTPSPSMAARLEEHRASRGELISLSPYVECPVGDAVGSVQVTLMFGARPIPFANGASNEVNL